MTPETVPLEKGCLRICNCRAWQRLLWNQNFISFPFKTPRLLSIRRIEGTKKGSHKRRKKVFSIHGKKRRIPDIF